MNDQNLQAEASLPYKHEEVKEVEEFMLYLNGALKLGLELQFTAKDIEHDGSIITISAAGYEVYSVDLEDEPDKRVIANVVHNNIAEELVTMLRNRAKNSTVHYLFRKVYMSMDSKDLLNFSAECYDLEQRALVKSEQRRKSKLIAELEKDVNFYMAERNSLKEANEDWMQQVISLQEKITSLNGKIKELRTSRKAITAATRNTRRKLK